MKILYLAPNRVVLEAENDRDRAELPGIAEELTRIELEKEEREHGQTKV